MFVIYHAVFHRFAVLKCGLRCIENHHPYRMEGKHFVEGLVFIYLIFLIIRLYFLFLHHCQMSEWPILALNTLSASPVMSS